MIDKDSVLNTVTHNYTGHTYESFTVLVEKVSVWTLFGNSELFVVVLIRPMKHSLTIPLYRIGSTPAHL